ncbi:MAG: hypothetical protein DCF22_06390, partial [Leptolyngbya sp.]
PLNLRYLFLILFYFRLSLLLERNFLYKYSRGRDGQKVSDYCSYISLEFSEYPINRGDRPIPAAQHQLEFQEIKLLTRETSLAKKSAV